MSTLTICVIASATGAYLIWGYQATKKDLKPGEGPSFSSLLLWSIIDTIMWVNTYRAGNDQTLIATYTILTVLLTLILIFQKKFGWSKTDWFVAGIAFSCLLVSYLTPPVIGVLCGALSIAAAGVPNLINISKHKPTKLLYLTIFFFFLGPWLSFMSILLKKEGGLKDYIYPVIAMSYWAVAYVIARSVEIRRCAI
jgi:drug/metabolite transporter (DMT)-like permease